MVSWVRHQTRRIVVFQRLICLFCVNSMRRAGRRERYSPDGPHTAALALLGPAPGHVTWRVHGCGGGCALQRPCLPPEAGTRLGEGPAHTSPAPSPPQICIWTGPEGATPRGPRRLPSWTRRALRSPWGSPAGPPARAAVRPPSEPPAPGRGPEQRVCGVLSGRTYTFPPGGKTAQICSWQIKTSTNPIGFCGENLSHPGKWFILMPVLVS